MVFLKLVKTEVLWFFFKPQWQQRNTWHGRKQWWMMDARAGCLPGCSWSTVVLGPSYCGTHGSQGYLSQKSFFGPPLTRARLLFLAPDGAITQNFPFWPLCHILPNILSSYTLLLMLPRAEPAFASPLRVSFWLPHFGIFLPHPPYKLVHSDWDLATGALLHELPPEPLIKACHLLHWPVIASVYMPSSPRVPGVCLLGCNPQETVCFISIWLQFLGKGSIMTIYWMSENPFFLHAVSLSHYSVSKEEKEKKEQKELALFCSTVMIQERNGEWGHCKAQWHLEEVCRSVFC